jgi:GNAT superfamily N-acetyltransferase
MIVGLDLRRVPFGDPVVRQLVAAVQEEYVVRYGSPDETPIDASVFEPPAGAFFLGSLEGVPVAIGGWRFRSDVAALGGSSAAEVKRMYVVPSARRAGHARVVLTHLEETAREAGADVMVLETGCASRRHSVSTGPPVTFRSRGSASTRSSRTCATSASGSEGQRR